MPMKPFWSAYSALTAILLGHREGGDTLRPSFRPTIDWANRAGCAPCMHDRFSARSSASGLCRRSRAFGTGLRLGFLRVVDPDLVRGGEAHGDGAPIEQHRDGAGVGRHLAD